MLKEDKMNTMRAGFDRSLSRAEAVDVAVWGAVAVVVAAVVTAAVAVEEQEMNTTIMRAGFDRSRRRSWSR